MRQALIANTMTIDGVKAPPLEVLQPMVSMATLVHHQGPLHPSTQPAALRGQHVVSTGTTLTDSLTNNWN